MLFMRSDYEHWLRSREYDSRTIRSQLHRVGRVEIHFGDLEQHYASDRLRQVLAALRYSTEDERRGRSNPTPIPIKGKLQTNLASYLSAVNLYLEFCDHRQEPTGENAQAAATVQLRLPEPIRRAAPLPRPAQRAELPPEHARTFAEFGFNGGKTLAALIVSSRYGTTAQAIASLSVFSHPFTVAQTGGKALFPIIRGVRGEFVDVDGRRLMADDNRSPFDAFQWANALGARWPDSQVNHIYRASSDPEAYTALPNIVVTPAFLAKLTDNHPEVRALLAWRSYDLYGWAPAGREPPVRPEGYAALEWAAPLPAVEDVAGRIAAALLRACKSRTAIAARECGWLFGEPQAKDRLVREEEIAS